MHIKKLEIAGFKSFVDRTVIHFDHDVIGIVGPNGCGKSNIVDAIRWCLGEQSAKHLRGRAMEDVIFNGSESRGPAGLSEVTITFDNTNPEYAATLPVEFKDYPEIAVTRRLFRDGTSEYLINKTQVRLRDVTELFLGTGVGTKAYSIIEQGRIGQIVSARPEDRRLFIEEAAGITKYRQRRKQAERKMELTRQNLLRINDIVSEIDRTRASLKRQVAKAERFLEYRRELDDLVLHDAAHRLLELIVVERVERAAYQEADASAAGVREKLRGADETLETARRDAAASEARADEASREAFEADNAVTALHAEIDRSRDRLAHLSERLEAGRNELEQITSKTRELRAEQEALDARMAGLDSDERAREADALAETEALSELQGEEARAGEAVLALRRNTGDLATRAAALEARLDGIAQRVADAGVRRDRLGQERERVAGELTSAIARRAALEKSLVEIADGKRLTEDERKALERELESLRARQLECERAFDTVKNETSLRRNRQRALEDLHRRMQGVGAGARALLSRNDARIRGMVADRFEAPEELTQAVAGLLGARLQTVVVENQAAGIELLAELQEGRRGRAEVVPARPGYVAGSVRAAASDERVLCRLADRLRYAPEDEALVRALVGDALVVQSASDAAAVAALHPGVTVVALDGTVARPDGTVSGGSGDDVASAMLEQKRELHQLAAELSRLEPESARLSEELTTLRARVAEVSTALERARREAHQGELAQVTAEKDLARTTADIGRAEARIASIDAELEEIARAIAGVQEGEAEARAELDTVRAERERLAEELARAEATLAEWRERVAAQSSLVTERRVRLAQVKEQLDAARSARARVEATLAEHATRAERLNTELDEAAHAYGETAARVLSAREARVEALLTARAAHERLDAAREQLESVRQSLSAQETTLKALRDELEELDARARKHEMAVQRMDLEREHLLAGVRERFRGLELSRVIGDYHARPAPDPEHRRRIDELTQLIDRMGPVNLDAKAEHDDAERRFKELSEQKIDIEKALEELDRAIRHMNRESKRRFRETFDEVNTLFKKTFSKLFRGGRAELLLTNPEDLLSTGVEILAQPPGKKVGNIELMSGGEKALTAVSLIFSILQHRPSPFCVLDEVDAPLDEANVARYNEMVRAMTSQSQFILITHIKKTMQSVDVLYGVTMGEPGVSRIVSVRVNENAATRSDSMVARSDGKESAPPRSAEAVAGVA
ncbi:MAG TPA: chromosome segregation protein SMC [Polyangiaceae bacterium]|nr:chromosome segregation protein SMC [Polyangiaceae bacterium]